MLLIRETHNFSIKNLSFIEIYQNDEILVTISFINAGHNACM